MKKTTALAAPAAGDKDDDEKGPEAQQTPRQELSLEVTESLPVKKILAQVKAIEELQRDGMKLDLHYGVIPGTGKKPTLLKPGAEKLCLMFRLAPKYVETLYDLGDDHLRYSHKCKLFNQITGVFVGEGVGSCSTMEKKYRYRKGTRVCPECGQPSIIKGKKEYGGGWLCWKKSDPPGCGLKWLDGDAAIEAQDVEKKDNEDLADSWNTVQKMSKKRALVDAVLTATAASDIFTQDVEDMPRDEGKNVNSGKSGKAGSTRKPAEKKKPEGVQEKRETLSDTVKKLFRDMNASVQDVNKTCEFLEWNETEISYCLNWLIGVVGADEDLVTSIKTLGWRIPHLVAVAKKEEFKNGAFVFEINKAAKAKADNKKEKKDGK